MVNLISDALIAAVTLIDRGWTAAENVLRFRLTPPEAVDGAAPPAGVGGQSYGLTVTGAGGHPVYPTSDLLKRAAGELHHAYDGRMPAVLANLQSELRLRASEFAAIGD